MVFRDRIKGALVTAAPEFLPSTLNCTLVVLAETFVVTEMVPETLAPETGEVIETTGGVPAVLLTSIETVALVAVRPPALLAAAASEWLPLERVAVFRERLKGALVAAAPEFLPSTVSCTLVVLNETFGVTEMIPETLAPETGEIIETVGKVGETVGGRGTVLKTSIEIAALVAVSPPALLATAVRE